MMTQKDATVPIGETLRQRRVGTLKKGLCEMARLLEITPAHLTDLERGRRGPSEDLMLRISRQYGIDEAELRAGWNKASPIVDEVATQDAMTAAKVPEFLRTARDLTPDQWNTIINHARRMTGEIAED